MRWLTLDQKSFSACFSSQMYRTRIGGCTGGVSALYWGCIAGRICSQVIDLRWVMAAKAPAFRDFKKVSRERGLFKCLRSSQSLISTCGKVNKTAVGRRGGGEEGSDLSGCHCSRCVEPRERG